MDQGLSRRLELDALLRSLLRECCGQLEGKENCYFDPPENLKINYPCIIYERINSHKTFADNFTYSYMRRYSVTIIDRDPDSILPDRMELLRLCTHDRDFVTDNLHHYVFTIYY